MWNLIESRETRQCKNVVEQELIIRGFSRSIQIGDGLKLNVINNVLLNACRL
jgi:hypothetical protein